MFQLFKKKQASGIVLGAPVKGVAVTLKEVSDPTFGGGMLGEGIAFVPETGEIYAPADGEIGMVFETLHAVTLITKEGAEILIHVGLDTVRLRGDGFEAHVKAGKQVKKGAILLTADLQKIQAAGCELITPMVVCNTEAFREIAVLKTGEVQAGEEVLLIRS